MFIRARTDEGIEGFDYLGDDFGLGQNIAKAVNEDFSKILIGRDRSDVENIWHDMRPLVRDSLGDRRIALHAQALADILCWDLHAKAHGRPVVSLLAQQRASVPIMVIAGYYTPQNSLSDLADETRDLITLGSRGMKLKVGGLSVAEDVEWVKTVRDVGGNTFNLAVDANQAWSLNEALDFVNACECLGLIWV